MQAAVDIANALKLDPMVYGGDIVLVSKRKMVSREEAQIGRGTNHLGCPNRPNLRFDAKAFLAELSNANLPIGGTTDLCHGSIAVVEAMRWFAINQNNCERPVIPALNKRFALASVLAVAAIRQANFNLGRTVQM